MSEHLAAADLARLTQAWETWASEGKTYAQKISRARLHLLFLLFRYGGLRLGEALELAPRTALDMTTGRLRVGGANRRDILMPMTCMGHLRRIISLPEAEAPDFLAMDQAFVRKKFYAVGQTLGLASNLVGPRALRYCRGLELLEQHVPPGLVLKFLGQQDPEQLRAFLRFADGAVARVLNEQKSRGRPKAPQPEDSQSNIFRGVVNALAQGLRKVRVELTTFADIRLSILCNQGDIGFYDITPGHPLSLYVDPSVVCLCRPGTAQPFTNRLPCELVSLHSDTVESFATLLLEDGSTFMAEMETPALERLNPREGERFLACFAARSVRIVDQ